MEQENYPQQVATQIQLQVVSIDPNAEARQGKAHRSDSVSSRARRKSTIGEENLAERTCWDKFMNVCGILLAIIMLGIDCYELSESDPPEFPAFIALGLAIISLLINIVDYKTGDCGCLRSSLMILTCLWPLKLCESCRERYDKISVKLLLAVNTLLWAVLLGFSVYDMFVSNESGNNNSNNTAVNAGTGAAKDFAFLVDIMPIIKLVIVILGLIASLILLLLKWIGIGIIKTLCCLRYIVPCYWVYLCCNRKDGGKKSNDVVENTNATKNSKATKNPNERSCFCKCIMCIIPCCWPRLFCGCCEKDNGN